MELRQRRCSAGAYRQLHRTGLIESPKHKITRTSAVDQRYKPLGAAEEHTDNCPTLTGYTERPCRQPVKGPRHPQGSKATHSHTTHPTTCTTHIYNSRDDIIIVPSSTHHTTASPTRKLPSSMLNTRPAVPGAAPRKMVKSKPYSNRNNPDPSHTNEHQADGPGLCSEAASTHHRTQENKMGLHQVVSTSGVDIYSCTGCGKRQLSVPNFWLQPICRDCAPTLYGFESTPDNLREWDDVSEQIRMTSLSNATIIRYLSLIRRGSWPLDTPFKTLQYIRTLPKSKTSIKQAVAAATRLHSARQWDPPPFNHHIVTTTIKAILRSPVETPAAPKPVQVFSKSEILLMFKALTPDFSPVYARDAAILAIQLFGARRASEVLNLRNEDITTNGKDYRIRIAKSKTDQRGDGEFFVLPQDTSIGINPSRALTHYLRQRKEHWSPQGWLFNSFDAFSRIWTRERLRVTDWNSRIKTILTKQGLLLRSSHAIRATAISLSSLSDVQTVAQVGGWRSLIYLTTYRRASAEAKTSALARIGSRALQQQQVANFDALSLSSDSQSDA